MRERGYVEGNTFAFEIRLAEGRYELLPKLAVELVHSRVDIIMAVAPSAVRAASRQRGRSQSFSGGATRPSSNQGRWRASLVRAATSRVSTYWS
jgi:hypothetical protein